jgi:HAD superfamily hydrolase (TIGR01459 family)
MTNSPSPGPVAGLAELTGDYRYILCDAWGVIHNGIEGYPAANDALARFRDGGGKVLVLTNAPRPKAEVVRLFDRLGIDRAAYDDVMTSGEAARELLAARPGARILHVGPERDLPLYEGLPVTFVGEEAADLISCTGFFDDNTETPDDYAERLVRWSARGLTMLCANPDQVVERGNRLVWCAGALAARYAALGGDTILVGKPHAHIYRAALARLDEIAGAPIDRAALLAIGDALETDLKGAVDAGIDVLFVTDGIHADDLGGDGPVAAASVAKALAGAGLGARGFIPRLVW